MHVRHEASDLDWVEFAFQSLENLISRRELSVPTMLDDGPAAQMASFREVQSLKAILYLLVFDIRVGLLAREDEVQDGTQGVNVICLGRNIRPSPHL